MSPALEAGDFVLVRRGHPPADARAAGLVVHVRGLDGRPLIKRVVGGPGDSLRVGDEVWINRRRLVEPYAHGQTPEAQRRGVHALGTDELFVLGDRRDASTDSRDFGPVRARTIEGVAVLRYWPPGRLGYVRRSARLLELPDQGTPADV